MTRQLSPGDHFGRYRIDGVLGRGGMGEVYLAYDAQLRRKVALKILLRDDEAHDAESSERLLREARAAAAIEHPNAVQVFDVDEVGDTPFMAMELVEGRPLRTYVTDETTPVATKIIWLTEIARALHAAHLRGVVHRDVKPENVIIRADGVVKVLDFGTARRVEVRPIASDGVSPMAMTSTDSPAVADAPTDRPMEGTLLYMAPEQVRGEEIDGLVDQWAWGVLAYELLAGARPWDGSRGGVAILSQILSSDPPELVSRARGITDGMSEVVLRALRKPKHERFGSLALAADALEAQTPILIEEAPTGRSSAWSSLLAAAALVAVALRLIALTPMAPPARHEAPATATAASEVGPPDYGSPMSTNPIALEAYRGAVQGLRDGASTTTIMVSLDRARAADSDFGAAYFRELLAEETLEGPVRDLFAETLRRRDRLGLHDLSILGAIEPLFRIPIDRDELRQRFAKLALDEDPDFDLQRCFYLIRIRSFNQAVDACKDAERLDPTLAAAYLGEAISHGALGDAAGEKAGYEECLERAPGSARCLEGLAQSMFNEGHCDEYASIAHQMVLITPDDMNAHALESVAVYAKEARTGVNLDGYRAAVDDATSRLEPEVRELFRLTSVAAQAIAQGRLQDAAAAYEGYAQRLIATGNEAFIREGYRLQLEVLMELGETGAATDLAKRWLRERAAWTPSMDEDSRIIPLAGLYRMNAISGDRFRAERTAWLKAARDRGGPIPTTGLWLDAYAAAVRTDADAAEAERALSDFAPPPREGRWPILDAALGRVALRAGHPEVALPRLKAVYDSCPDVAHPLPQFQAVAVFAEALAPHDRHEACTVAEALLARWDHIPRSEAAARARKVWVQLACNSAGER